MLSPNLLRSQILYIVGGGGDVGGRGAGVGDKLFSIFDAESKSAEIPNSLYSRGLGVCDEPFPTFDAEFKSAEIPNCLYKEGWVGVGGGWVEENNNF